MNGEVDVDGFNDDDDDEFSLNITNKFMGIFSDSKQFETTTEKRKIKKKYINI